MVDNHITQAIKLAEKIAAMANEPVDGLVRRMKLLGWPAQYQTIVLEAMAHKVAAEVAKTRQEERTHAD